MEQRIRILMLEDVETDAELELRALRRDGIDPELRRVETREAFLAALEQFAPDIILSDCSLPRFDGFSALALAREHRPQVPFLFVSGTIGEEVAISALKSGAVDYVLKGNLQRLPSAVRRALDESRTRAAQQQAETRFRDLIEFAPDAIVLINQHGVIEIVNRRMELLFGYPREELVGGPSGLLVPQRYAQWHQALGDEAALARLLEGPLAPFEVSGRRRDGSEFPAEVSLSPLQTDGGLWVSGVIRDISERRAQEERLARLTRIRAILGSISSVILRIRDRQRLLREACRIVVEEGRFAGAAVGLVDADNLLVTPVAWAGIDPHFLREVPVSADPGRLDGQGMVGTAMRTRQNQVAHDLLREPDPALWSTTLLEHGYRSTFVLPLVTGEQAIGVLVLFSTTPDAFNDEEQQLLTALTADISFALDYIAKSEQLNYLAYFDAITGLPNRALFRDRTEQLITQSADAEPEKIAVVLVDIERFRDLNDTLGRACGDDILRTAARRLADIVPDPNHLARLNADCFALIVRENASGTEVVNLLERRLNPRLAEQTAVQGREVRISVKAGIAIFPSDGASADILLRNAETALKNAKAAKAHYLFYTAEMNRRTAEKFSIETRLRRALEQEQFLLHYQPKYDLASGRIVGLEALLRWEEPGTGLVLPGTFIPVLEETGLIVEVGAWVIRRALRQYREWQQAGIAPPRIAVNVSQLQLRQKGFVTGLQQQLGPDAGRALEIEITESLFMEGRDRDA
ncbi:MAG: diguanylate cyclase, partial [Burkholderiaceae bacterium]